MARFNDGSFSTHNSICSTCLGGGPNPSESGVARPNHSDGFRPPQPKFLPFQSLPQTLQATTFVDRGFQLLKWPHRRNHGPNVLPFTQKTSLPVTNIGGQGRSAGHK